MKRKYFAKRTIAALLAFVLAFTSMNFDVLGAYADDVAIEESQENSEYVEEETTEAEVSADETIQNEGEDGGAQSRYIRMSNCDDIIDDDDAHIHFQYSVDEGQNYSPLFNGDEINDIDGITRVDIQVNVDEGYSLVDGRVRIDGEEVAVITASTSEWADVYNFENTIEFEHFDIAGDEVEELAPGLNIDDSYDYETNSFADNWKKEITLQAIRETRFAKLGYIDDAGSICTLQPEDLYVEKKGDDGTYSKTEELVYYMDCDRENCYAIQAKGIGEYRIYTTEIDENNYVTVHAVLPNLGMYRSAFDKDIDSYCPEGEVIIPNYNYELVIADSYEYEEGDSRTFLVARKERVGADNFTDEDFIAPEADEYNSYVITNTDMTVTFFEGSTDFKYCFREILKDNNGNIKLDSRINMSPVLSKEGLVMMYRYTDDEGNLAEAREDGENAYSYYDNVFSCIGSIDNLVLFGKNSDSTVGTYKDDDGRVMALLDDYYRDQSVFKDGFVIEKKGEAGYSATEDMTISYDEPTSSWHIKSSVPGKYRISNTAIEISSFVFITINEQTRFIEVRDEDDTVLDLEGNGDYFNLRTSILSEERTFTIKPSDETASSVKAVAYACESYSNLDEEGQYVSVPESGNETVEYVVWDSSKGTATVKIPANYSNYIFIKFAYVYGTGDAAYTINQVLAIDIDENYVSEKGLVAKTWIEYSSNNGQIDFSSFSFGESASYSKYADISYIDGERFIAFYNSTDTQADNSKSYDPVTSGLTVKKFVNKDGKEGWEAATTNDITLTYVGDEEGLPEGMEGLWKLTPKTGGIIYRIYAEDGTYVELKVRTTNLALFNIGSSGISDFENVKRPYSTIYLSGNCTYEINCGDEFDSENEWSLNKIEYCVNGNTVASYAPREEMDWAWDWDEPEFVGDTVEISISDVNEAGITLTPGYYSIRIVATSSKGWRAEVQYSISPSEYGLVINDCTDEEGNFGNSWRKNTSIQAFCETRSCLIGFNKAGLIGDGTKVEQIGYTREQLEEGTYISDLFIVKIYDEDTGDFAEIDLDSSDFTISYSFKRDCYVLHANKAGTYRIYDDEELYYFSVDVRYPENGFYAKDVADMATGYTSYTSGTVYLKEGVEKTVYTHLCTDSYGDNLETKEWFAIREYGTAENVYISKDSLKDGATYEVSGCTISLTANDNIAFTFDGSKIGFDISFKVDYDDGENKWSSENYLQISQSMVGLVLSIDEKTVRKNDFDDEYFSTYEKSITCEGELNNPCHLAWNDRDNVYIYTDEGDDPYPDVTPIFSADTLTIEKKSETGEYVKTSDLTITKDEEDNLRICCEVPGEYRISATTENEDYADCNYVYVTISVPSKVVNVYEDSALTKQVAGCDLYYTGDDRTYYLTAEDRKGGEVSLVGFTFPGVDATIENESGWPESYYGIDEEENGVSISVNENIIALTLRGKDTREDDNLILVFESEYEDYTERFAYEFGLRMSERGLVAKDWIELVEDEETGEITYTYGQNYETGDFARFNKSIEASVSETSKLVEFEINNTDEISDDSKAYSAVTSGLTVMRRDGDNWVETDAIELEYFGDEEGVPENMKGLWEMRAHSNGTYRIYESNGSFVEVYVAITKVGLFTTNAYSMDSYINPNECLYANDFTEVYLKAYDELRGESGKIVSIEIFAEGDSDTFDFDAGEWADGSFANKYASVEKINDSTYRLLMSMNYFCSFSFEAEYTEGENTRNEYSEYSFSIASPGLTIKEYMPIYDYMYTWSKELDHTYGSDLYFVLGVNGFDDNVSDAEIIQNIKLEDITIEKKTVSGEWEVTDEVKPVIAVPLGKHVIYVESIKLGEYRLSLNGVDDYAYIIVSAPSVGFFYEPVTIDNVDEKIDSLLCGYTLYTNTGKTLYACVPGFKNDSEDDTAKYDYDFSIVKAGVDKYISFDSLKEDTYLEEFGIKLTPNASDKTIKIEMPDEIKDSFLITYRVIQYRPIGVTGELEEWIRIAKTLQVAPDKKGLVINSNLAIDDETGEFTGEVRNVENYGKEDWFDYRNYPCFVLAKNSEAFEVRLADQVFAVSGTNNLKLEFLNGDNWVEKTDVLTCDDNNVFRLETYEPGDYRITYVEPGSQYDETYVDIHISAPYIGFFDEESLNQGTFNLDEEHIYHNDSYEITRGDILMQKKTFYALRVSPKEEEGTKIDSSFNIKAKRIVDGKEVETVLVNNGSIVGNNKQISVEEVTGYPIYCDGTDDISANCKLYKITVSDLYSEDANIPFGSYFFEINNNVEAKIGDQVLYAYDDCAGLSAIGADVDKFISSWKLNHERFNNTPVEIVFEDALYKKLFYIEYAYENELDDENADKSAKTNPGKVYYRIFGNENFNPETWQEGSFEIQPALISDADVSVTVTKNLKSGKAEASSVCGFFNEFELNYGIDYAFNDESSNDVYYYSEDTKTAIEDTASMEVGKNYTVKIFGMGQYFEGEGYAGFTYEGGAITDESIVGTRNFVATYTGSQITVDPLVKVDGITMTENVDYKIVYKTLEGVVTTPVNVGNYLYEVWGIGNLKIDSMTRGQLEIKAADLSAAKDLKVELVTATGNVAFPAKMTYDEVESYVEKGITVAVTVGGKTLTQDTDYEAGFETPVKAGTMNFVVTYKGNYSGKTTKTVAVSSETVFSASTVTVEVVGSDFTYIGEAIEPEVTVTKKNGNKLLTLGEDYTVTYASNVNAGTATVTVTGVADKGYSGSAKASFAIAKTAMTAGNVTVDSTAVYNPAGVTPSVKVCIVGEGENAKYAKEGTDYVLKYENNKAAGTGKVTVTFKGNLTGSPVEKEFTITPASIVAVVNNSTINYFAETEGDYITPVTELADGTAVLKEGTDYTVTYTAVSEGAEVKDGKLKAGSKTSPYEYSVTITGKGNYTGTDNQEDNVYVSCINRTDISDYVIKGLEESYTYNTDIADAIQTAIADGKVYAEKEDKKITALTVTVPEISKVGKAKVYFMADNSDDYSGTIAAEITVDPKKYTEIRPDYVLPEGVEGPYLDKKGKLVMGEIHMYDDYAEKELVQGKDYTVKYSYDKLENGGEATATLTFKGNYTGTVTVILGDISGYRIESLASVTGYKDAVYTGKEINYKFNVKVNAVTATGERFVATLKAEDYDVNYLRDGYTVESVKDAGRYCMNIAPKGKYYTDNYDGKVWYFPGYEAVGFNITQAPISKAKLTLGTTKYEFNETIASEGATPTVTVKFNNIEVPADQYTVVYTGNKKPGTGHVAVIANEYSLNSNFTGELTGKFDITGSVDLTKTPGVEVTVGNTAYYNPDGAIPNVSVTFQNDTLVLGEDYTITAKNNKAVGTDAASLTITGKGKYKGTTQSYSYSITPADLSSSEYQELISYSKVKTAKYYGTSYKYMTTTYNGKGQVLDPGVMVGKKALKLGVDYELTYYSNSPGITGMVTEGWSGSNVTNVGEYMLHITGKGNYENVLYSDVAVIVSAQSAKSVKYKAATVNYDGEPVTNTISDVKVGSLKLVEGVDYYVSYDKKYVSYDNSESKLFGAEVVYSYQMGEDIDNVLPGKKTAYIVGIGNYRYMGAKEVNYTIKGIDIGKAKYSKLSDYTFTGSGVYIDGDLAITATIEGKPVTLEYGKDYWISYPSETVSAGTKTAIVNGMGMFEGTSKKISYKVKAKKFVGTVNAETLMVYSTNASAHPVLAIVDENNLPLTEGKDYTVKLANNKSVGSRDSKKAPTMTITFKGNYTGSEKVTYDIVKAGITGEYYRVSAANVATTVDKKTGFVKAYKATPVVKSVDGKTTLKAGTDYTIKYTYDTDTLVYDGKTKQWVTRIGGTEVQAKDQFKAGVAIRVCVEGKNNFEGGNTALYYVVQK